MESAIAHDKKKNSLKFKALPKMYKKIERNKLFLINRRNQINPVVENE